MLDYKRKIHSLSEFKEEDPKYIYVNTIFGLVQFLLSIQ